MKIAAIFSAIVPIIDAWLKNKNQAFDELMADNEARYMGSKDRKHFKNWAFGIIRHYQFLSETLQNNEIEETALNLGLLYIFHYDNENFEIIQEEHQYAKPIAPDAIKIIRAIIIHPTSDYAEVNLPNFVYKLFRESYDHEAIRTMILRPNLPEIRVRYDKHFNRLVQEFQAQILPNVPNGMRLSKNEALTHHPNFKQGKFDIQSYASQLACELIKQTLSHNLSILDLCAGAGGKSLNLGQDFLQITLTDIDNKRLLRAKDRLIAQRIDAHIVHYHNLAGKKYEIIMIDAPCSGSGNFNRNPWAAFGINQQKIHHYMQSQTKLLQKSLEFAPRYIIYMTCSAFDCENQARIAEFLQKNPQFREITSENFNAISHDSDGFFISILEKTPD